MCRVGVAHGLYSGCGPWTVQWVWPMDCIVGVAHGLYSGCGPWTVQWMWPMDCTVGVVQYRCVEGD